jgi:hypothetical protein
MQILSEFLNKTPAKTLYHYTNAIGLLGILEGSIWASSAYHLNDPGEFRFAISLIGKRVQERFKTESRTVNKKYDQILYVLQEMPEPIQVYVASFSEEGDLLSQWLAYPRAQTGYAIGLSPHQFDLARIDGFRLVPCVYNGPEQDRLVDAIIDAWIQLPSSVEDSVRAIQENILAVAAAIKHPGFGQEAEWRLIKIQVVGAGQSRSISFRSGRNGLVPYLHAPLAPDGECLKPASIHIGPNEDMQAANAALLTLLDAKGFFSSASLFALPDFPVICSKTPYRP